MGSSGVVRVVVHLLFALFVLNIALIVLARRQNSGAWIAYTAFIEGRSELFLMTGDGDSVRRISQRSLCGANPRWSPDGEWIAFVSRCTNSDDVYLMRPGGALVNLSSAPNSTGTPRWSPDGRHLVAVCCRISSLYLIDVQANRQRRLANSYMTPNWSPDGEWIYAFPLFKPDSALERVHVTTGRAERVLPAQASLTIPHWSPDGGRIVLGLPTESGDELFIMPAEGFTLEAVPIDLPFSHVRAPVWSPDGEWIAFLGGEPFAWHVYRVRPDGRNFERLSQQTGNHDSFHWSPDGEWLLFSADYDGGTNIYRLRADGSVMQKLAPGSGPQYAPTSPRERFSAPLVMLALALGGAIFSRKWVALV